MDEPSAAVGSNSVSSAVGGRLEMVGARCEVSAD